MEKRFVTEQNAIKHRVDDVAQGTSQNERQRHQGAFGGFGLFDHAAEHYTQEYDGCNAEKREKQFAVIASKLITEGHAVVFDEINLEVFAQHIEVLTQKHLGFDQ